MSNLRPEIDDIGRRIWPDPHSAYRAMRARRRRWWLAALQPRRPQLATRWLPVLAAVATVAIFVALAGARPALERTQGQGNHAVIPAPIPPGDVAGNSQGVPTQRGGFVVPPSRAAGTAPPAAAAAPPVANNGSASSPERPAASSAGVPTVVLTEADAGRTITVAPGTRIVVTLQAPPHRQWTAPRALDSAVLSTSESASDAGGGAHGTFVAAHPGKTRLVAGQGGCHGPLCLIASTGTWQVRIVVS